MNTIDRRDISVVITGPDEAERTESMPLYALRAEAAHRPPILFWGGYSMVLAAYQVSASAYDLGFFEDLCSLGHDVVFPELFGHGVLRPDWPVLPQLRQLQEESLRITRADHGRPLLMSHSVSARHAAEVAAADDPPIIGHLVHRPGVAPEGPPAPARKGFARGHSPGDVVAGRGRGVDRQVGLHLAAGRRRIRGRSDTVV
jgi:hypothetical protein